MSKHQFELIEYEEADSNLSQQERHQLHDISTNESIRLSSGDWILRDRI